MGRLVGDLLLLARADAGDLPSFLHERVDLSEVATEVVDQARPRAAAHQLSITCESRCVVLGDRDRLKQLVTNLVENAIRYTPAGGRIEVSVRGATGLQQRGQPFVLELLQIRAIRFPWRTLRFLILGLASHPPTCRTYSSGSIARTRRGRGRTVGRVWACRSLSTLRRSTGQHRGSQRRDQSWQHVYGPFAAGGSRRPRAPASRRRLPLQSPSDDEPRPVPSAGARRGGMLDVAVARSALRTSRAQACLRRRVSTSTATATSTSATTRWTEWSSSARTARCLASGAARALRRASSAGRSGWPSTPATRCSWPTS